MQRRPPPRSMQLVVSGASGAGRSTLAASVGEQLGLPPFAEDPAGYHPPPTAIARFTGRQDGR
ncbi:MAG: hypothetical protein ACR2KI_04480 [Candidatus Limnocylindria bacterium]